MKAFTSFKQLIHWLVLAKLKQYINILAIFEKMLEVAHVTVLDTAMYLDFAH